jgi:ABC-type thiamine transport system substrate-binding protein
MKKYLTIVPLLFLLAGITFAQDKVPKLVVKSFEHDFGKIKEGVKVSHTFELKNEGNADLVIEGVAPS